MKRAREMSAQIENFSPPFCAICRSVALRATKEGRTKRPRGARRYGNRARKKPLARLSSMRDQYHFLLCAMIQNTEISTTDRPITNR